MLKSGWCPISFKSAHKKFGAPFHNFNTKLLQALEKLKKQFIWIFTKTCNETAQYRTRLNIRNNFFTERCIKTWNNLPEKVVQAKNLNIFKNRLDKHWEDQKLKMEFFV